MIDRYIIEELTPEDLERELQHRPESKVTVKLVETGYKPITLGRYETIEAAEKSKAEWIARNELSDEIADFYREMIDNYGTILDEKEITEMIKGYS